MGESSRCQFQIYGQSDNLKSVGHETKGMNVRKGLTEKRERGQGYEGARRGCGKGITRMHYMHVCNCHIVGYLPEKTKTLV